VAEKRVSKASIVTIRQPRSNKRPDELEMAFRSAGALDPPYDPKKLCATYVASSILRPNVDAYEVNIDRSGYRLEPTIKLEGPHEDVLKAVRMVLVQEGVAEGRTVIPDQVEVSARLAEMKQVAELERAQFESFVANCAPALGISELRARTRQDLEATGNAYWEVIRDDEQLVFEHLRSVEMRIMPLDRDLQKVKVPYRITPCTVAMVPTERRFRRYVQIIQGVETVYFKELGDPRVMSSASGKFYESEEAMQRAERNARPATEVLHFLIYSPWTSPYGIPRWIGAGPAVRGAGASEAVNASYFDEKGIPNGILSVSAGDFGEGGVDKIRQFFNEAAKGQENFHKVLVLEIPAQVSDGLGQASPPPKVQFDPLSGALHKDGQFQEYEKNAERKVGTQFRVPAIFRGDSNDYNRATSETAADVTNEQVFGPARQAFDEIFNTRILPILGIRYWRFVSGQATKMDPEVLTKIAENGVKAGILTPNEGRKLYSEALGREYQDEEWGKTPKPTSGGVGDQVKELVAARAELEREAFDGFAASTDHARLDDATDEVDLGQPPASLQ
jgi:PBSX family phage portal protein